MRRVLAFVLLVVCAAAAQETAQKAPPPYRLFNLVTDESIVAKLNQYGADGYRFAAAAQASGGGRVYLMERAEGGPFEYAIVAKPIFKGQFYEQINALGERGFRFVPGTFAGDPPKSLFKAPDFHALMEKTPEAKKYEYTSTTVLALKNFYKDIAKLRSDAFVPVAAIKDDDVHIALLERVEGAVGPANIDPEFYTCVEMWDVKDREKKLLPTVAAGYRVRSLEVAYTRNAGAQLFVFAEKSTAKPEYKIVATDVKVDKKNIVDVTAAENADIEKQMNEGGANGYRLALPPVARIHFTGFAAMWREVFALMEKAPTAYEYKLVIEEDTPALSRRLAALYDQGFRVTRDGLLSGDTAIVERLAQAAAAGK